MTDDTGLEQFRLDMAYAFGEGLDPLAYRRRMRELRGWTG